jgi:nucleotide-binding universal stress UspA family protein
MKIERILVALDASPHSVAALEAATGLAVMQRADLIGLFVEDIDLLRLAGLPFAREMIYPAMLGRQIEVPLMEDRLKELAETARQELSQAAVQAGVHWHFRVRRGGVLGELLKETAEADLLVAGKASHVEKRRHVRLGTTAAHLLARSPRPVLALQHGEVCRGPALLVCDGSPESLAGLPGAVTFARMLDGTPVILLLARDREEAIAIKEKIEDDLGLKEVRFRRCKPTETGGLVRLAHEEEAGLVVLVGIPFGVPPEDLPQLLHKLDCPILAYR